MLHITPVTYHREGVSGGSVGVGAGGGGVGCILGAQVESGRRWGGDSPLQCLNLTVRRGKRRPGDDTFTKHHSDVAFSHLKVLMEHFSKMAQQFWIVVK